MFIARIELAIKPSERSAFRAYVAEEAPLVRALAGCVRYRFSEDVTEPSHVLLYEEWASRAEFEAYKSSPLFTGAGATLGPMLAAPPSSAYYESDDVFTSCAVGAGGARKA